MTRDPGILLPLTCEATVSLLSLPEVSGPLPPTTKITQGDVCMLTRTHVCERYASSPDSSTVILILGGRLGGEGDRGRVTS